MRLNKFQSSRFITAALAIMSLLFFSCDKQPIGPTGPDPVGPPAPGTYMSFTDFRALHSGGGDVTVPAGTKKIRGVVISNSANEAAGNYRLQDESGSGVYFYSVVGSPIYSMGSVLEINPVGGVLTLYNGDLELKSVPQANVVPVGGTITVTPRVTTIAQIIANKNAWASSLVKINGITSVTQASSNATGVTYTITDATGTLSTFVRVASGIVMPSLGGITSLTGYVSIFNTTTQVQIRTAADVQ
jgi:Family of unknown function (DUF5689)